MLGKERAHKDAEVYCLPTQGMVRDKNLDILAMGLYRNLFKCPIIYFDYICGFTGEVFPTIFNQHHDLRDKVILCRDRCRVEPHHERRFSYSRGRDKMLETHAHLFDLTYLLWQKGGSRIVFP